MRRPGFALAALLLAGSLIPGAAADQRRASPHDTVSANVDGAEIAITYGRPYMRGRTIMGALVPYGVVWATGADEATTLTTTRSLQFGTLRVPAGRYSLWTLPSAGAWQLIVNAQTGQWHTQYDARQDVGRVDMVKRALGRPVQQLAITIAHRGGRRGELRIAWETTEVSVRFTVVE